MIPDQPEYYVLRNIFRFADKNRDLFRVSFSERGSAALSGRVRDLVARIFLYDLRNLPILHESFSNVPAEIVAQTMAAVATGMISWWLETPNDYAADEMASMLYQVLYRERPPSTGLGR